LEKVLDEKIRPWSLRLVGEQQTLKIVVWLGGFEEMVQHQQKMLASFLGPPKTTIEDGFGYFKAHNLKWPTATGSLFRFIGSRRNVLDFIRELNFPASYSFDADLGGGRVALAPFDNDLEIKTQKASLSPASRQSGKLGGHIFRRLKTLLDPNQTFKLV
jgi:hypothetical protein